MDLLRSCSCRLACCFLQVVLNYDAPRNLETYLHRVGRTARAGLEGLAVSLVTDDDRGLLKSVVKQGRVTLKQRVVPHQVCIRVCVWSGTGWGAGTCGK